MSPGKQHRARRLLTLVLRVLFTAALLWFVVKGVDFEQIQDGWQHSLGPALAVSFLLLLLTLVLSALRWVIASKIIGVQIGMGRASAIVLVGHFFSQLLPTSFGGDAIRGWYLWRRGTSLQKAFLSVLFDRLIGMSALLLLVVAGLPLLAGRLQSSAPIVLLCAILAGATVGLLVFFNLDRLPVFVRRLRFWPLLERLSGYARRFLAAPLQSGLALAISLAIHAMALYSTAIISDALGAPLSMLDALLIVPTVLVISALPVSIGGWGVREAGLAGGFTLLGLPPAVAVTTSVLFGAVNLAGGCVGGVVFAIMGSPRPTTPRDAS